MKNKKNLLSVLLAVVLLALCVLGFLMTGANAGELDPNTTVYLIREADGNDDGSVTDSETENLVFKTIRGATAYAKEQTWGANEKLRIEIAQETLNMGLDGNYLFVGKTVKLIEREDHTSLPITITRYGDMNVTVNVTMSNHIALVNDYYISDIALVADNGTTSRRWHITNRTEFHNVVFNTGFKSHISASANNFSEYCFTEDNLAVRLDENGEYTAEMIFSGNTVIQKTSGTTTPCLYGTYPYNGEAGTGTDTDLGKKHPIGEQELAYNKINGRTVLKDTAKLTGYCRVRGSTFLGDGTIELQDNAHITQYVIGSLNRNVKGGAACIFKMTGGTIDSYLKFFDQTTIGAAAGSSVQFSISGGTVVGAITAANNASSEGTCSLDITGGTIAALTVNKTGEGDCYATLKDCTVKGNVSGGDVRLNGGTIYHGARATTIAATSVAEGATVLVKQQEGVLHKDGVTALSVPAEYAQQIQISNESADGFNPRGYLFTETDDTTFKVISNIPSPESAILVLDERVHVKILISKDDIEHAKANSGKKFAYYCTTLGIPEEAPVQLEWDEIPVYDEDSYVIEFPAVSADKFDATFTFMCSVTNAVQESINTLATAGVTEYAESDPEAAAMFNALLDYGKATVEGTTALDHFDANAVASLAIPAAARPVKGEGAINFTNVTLLMGDTLGIRFKADGATTGATVKFNGAALAADQFAIGENCVDLYVSAVTLLNPIPVEIYDAEGVLCASFGYSVAGIANSIYTADNTNLKAASILNLIAAIENYVA